MGVFGARALGLFLCVRLTLTYLRHNLPQELLAEVHGVRQSTVSRVIANTQDLARPAHRPQKSTKHPPHNHSNPRTHIHIHPMNKPP